MTKNFISGKQFQKRTSGNPDVTADAATSAKGKRLGSQKDAFILFHVFDKQIICPIFFSRCYCYFC